jgi:transposase
MIGVLPGLVRVEGTYQDEDAQGPVVVIRMRPRAHVRFLCPHCWAVCPGYDRGRPQVRRWRALDSGLLRTYVEAHVPRVSCIEHGVVTAAVPWARHGARHTYAFEQVAAWSATEMSGTAAARLLRCSWRTIGDMVDRVLADLEAAAGSDGLDGLARIGIDEISYRRGHRYLTVIVDHDSRRLVWAKPGRDRATVESFFDALGEQRTRALTHITSDSAAWIARPVTARAGHAVHAADPFHVVRWAGTAMEDIRRKVWNAVRVHRGRNRPAVGASKTMRKVLWALRKDASNWSAEDQAAMAWVAATAPELQRAWRLKEALRAVFAATGEHAVVLLEAWLAWASRSRLPEFVEAGRKIRHHRASIEACLRHGLNNGLTESTNTKIRLIARRAYGFNNVHNMIALAKLSLGHHKPVLPT